MRKFNITILIAAILFTTVSAIAQEPKSACEGIDLHWLQVHVPLPPSKIVTKRPVGGLCEVVLGIGNELVGVYAGEDFLIAGEMFKQKTQVTHETLKAIQQQRDLALKDRFPQLKPKMNEVVAFEYGQDKSKTLYMFTDPLCPYCTKAGNQLKQMADEMGFCIKVLLYNVHGDNGRDNAVAAVCRSYGYTQYLSPDWKKSAKGDADDCEKGRQMLEGAMGIGKELGISGVPYFITDDGTVIRGADMDAITKALGS